MKNRGSIITSQGELRPSSRKQEFIASILKDEVKMCSCGLNPHTETRLINMFCSYAQISIQSSDSLRYICLLHILTYNAPIGKKIYTACCPLSPTPKHHGTEIAGWKIQVLNTMCMNEDSPQYSTFVHMEALCHTEKLATRKNQVLKDEHKKL